MLPSTISVGFFYNSYSIVEDIKIVQFCIATSSFHVEFKIKTKQKTHDKTVSNFEINIISLYLYFRFKASSRRFPMSHKK